MSLSNQHNNFDIFLDLPGKTRCHLLMQLLLSRLLFMITSMLQEIKLLQTPRPRSQGLIRLYQQADLFELIILLLLGALGVFPDSVDSQRLSGTYTISNVKYGLYILAGLLGWLGCHMTNKVLDTENQHKQAKEVQLPASALPSSHRSIAYLTYPVLILSAVAALISIALTCCWEMIWLTKSTSQKVYSWIIVVLTIVQRLFYIWACLATCKLLHSVCFISRDGISLTMAKGTGFHIPSPASEIMANKGTGLHIPFPASEIMANKGAGLHIPSPASEIMANKGTGFHIPSPASEIMANKGAGLHIPSPASEIMANKGTGLHIPFPARTGLHIPSPASEIMTNNKGTGLHIPSPASEIMANKGTGLHIPSPASEIMTNNKGTGLHIPSPASEIMTNKGAGFHIPSPASEIMTNKGTGLHIPFPAEIL
ncbi:hypothetical protein CEUSTIGMA_g3271.t1 [Chlamydomonas eustigma]|uniref:Uncharacterized protein n=1 Tax=Chlamydomonas eustigma TaxID=1157962 RepID=A0A250WYA1_9CHLO|nr:hypothetical protein CEUSTIGMA_g3271.t1 [Chlamydomonas eustigma]|eukprot:GAX75828.1 hypothetical protein CEUSTIGMA_g3271.t1 [Chlamydomonas eustigma]